MNANGNIESRELIVRERAAALAEPRAVPTLEAEPLESQDSVSLAAYWHILLKRRWTVFTVAIVLTTVVAIVSFRMTPVYRATARVQVEAETPLVQSLNDIYQKADADDAFLQTQIQVLKSDNLAWRTVEQLNLSQNPTFIPAEKMASIDVRKRKMKLIGLFKDDLTIELMPKTRMLMVGFESTDPDLAAQVATSLVGNYIDYNFRQKYDATRQASGWMEQQLDELKAKVEKSQQALVEYERTHDIVNTNEKQNVVEQMLSDLSKDLTTAQSERIQKESLYREVLSNRAQLAALAHNELLQKLEEKAAELKGQYTEVVAQYGTKFPKTLRLQQQIDENQTQIEREQNRVIERIHNDYTAAVNRQSLALAAVGRQKEDVGKLNQLLVQHNILQREFETNQQLYQNLLQRLKDATVSAGLRSTNIHLVDAALAPIVPVRPKRALNIAIGLLAGIILGVIGAFAQEGLDHTIKSAEEVESLLSTPTLAVIPLEHRQVGRAMLRRGSEDFPSGGRSVALTLIERPKSSMAEAYRALRTAILLSLASQQPKTLLVTSTQSGEGKTVTTLNLAQAMAQQKGPVLLIDCDLRKGGIAQSLNLDNSKGIATVLTGAHEVEDVMVPFPGQSNLWILPSGPVPPNPAELLASDRMALLLEKLAVRFEHVIIDSPPVLAVTDATVLSTLADGVILVAASGSTPRGGLIRTRRVLDSAGAHILGVALNKLDLRHQGYYGHYGYHYYGSQYGKYPYGGSSER